MLSSAISTNFRSRIHFTLAGSEAAKVKNLLPNRVADEPVVILRKGMVILSTEADVATACRSRSDIPGWLGEKSQ